MARRTLETTVVWECIESHWHGGAGTDTASFVREGARRKLPTGETPAHPKFWVTFGSSDDEILKRRQELRGGEPVPARDDKPVGMNVVGIVGQPMAILDATAEPGFE